KRLLNDANVQRLLPEDAFGKDGLPDGVFASSRMDGHTSYLFLYQVEDHTSPELPLGRPMTDMKTGKPVSSVVLPPYGYAILKYDI
ncbi:MAG: hypothetical protein ILO68_03230, partial [Clostridia bacterium]|nr:hypothetical protein [Clostridia bacterium]